MLLLFNAFPILIAASFTQAHIIASQQYQLTVPSDADHVSSPESSPLISNHGTHHDEARFSGPKTMDLRKALAVMQTWYSVALGTWPSGIDWTRAVLNTHVVATLSTLSKSLDPSRLADRVWLQRDGLDNEINQYFTQSVIAYYFGEDTFALRLEAYDDMLWVVLSYLESNKFIEAHSRRHFEASSLPDGLGSRWYGTQFLAPFAHRARVFYDLASRGWDEKYCGGGMVWSPWLGPYKNAISNMLYISASASMYLHFPGDNDTSPYGLDGVPITSPSQPFDQRYLDNAIKGYDWLKNSNMTNRQGLYVDGFHISNWRHNGTKCDIRDNMVYTYNQGVILSGLRSLWEAAGNRSYLEDGHTLVRNVMNATSWNPSSKKRVGPWSGLGRNGILEDFCDSRGRCSQDSQTFKSIFFHHLALFCEPLPLRPRVPGKTQAADKLLAFLHRNSCKEYAAWVARNAEAALRTRDEAGRFGMWWGADDGEVDDVPFPDGAVDYRDDPAALLGERWRLDDRLRWADSVGLTSGLQEDGTLYPISESERMANRSDLHEQPQGWTRSDANDRGRGRTVETQAGGVAVLRCLWELLHIE